MPQSSGKIETIGDVSDAFLSSPYQIDIPSLNRALSRKPTYKTYKTLLVHQRTLKCLNANVDRRLQKADAELDFASESLKRTAGYLADALADACNSTASPTTTETDPTIVGSTLRAIIGHQTFSQEVSMADVLECRSDQLHARKLLEGTSERVKKVEQKLVKKYDILTVDDEGKQLLDEHKMERVIDLMVAMPGASGATWTRFWLSLLVDDGCES